MKSLLSLVVGLAISGSALANSPTFDEYVVGLKQEALEKGISQSTLDAAFADVEYKKRSVKADRNQPERRLTLDEYIPRAVPDWKVKQAKGLYQKHYDELNRIGAQYGVPPRFIVALWGVESNFGKFTGNFNVISALSTLAYEGRREAFFRKETLAALTILEQGHIAPENMKGSWAGAMGQCQFMPSSFLTLAADGNADGRKDIWNTKADVFASTANYLSESGWQEDYTWGRQVKLPKGFDMSLQGREAAKGKYITEWNELGVRRYNGSPLPKLSQDIKAWLVAPDDENGRVYLVYNNYNVLMKWNRSHYFAIAVSHLADRIAFD